MKINHRHYILMIFALASIAVSVLCYIFLYRQTTSQANNYLASVEQLEVEKSSVDYEHNLIETYNTFEEDRMKIESFIVKEDQLVNFIEQIEKVGTDSKTKLEFSSIASADNKIKTRVTVEGNWSQVMTALIMIENLPVSLVVSNVRLDAEMEPAPSTTTSTKAAESQVWRLSLDLEVLSSK